MKSTELTVSTANLALILYILYAIFFVPFNATLISIATGLVAYGTLESYETAVALTLISGVIFALLVKQTHTTKEGFSGGNPKEISTRIATMTSSAKAKEPSGTYASPFVEGFADLSGNIPNDTVTAASTTTPQPAATVPVPTAVAPPATGNSNPPAASPSTFPNSGFRSGGTESDSLFKLGVIPEQDKGGFHIDQGTTVINALNALKPDQVKQMTDDTQKLIDTQKNLMSLLSTVKPMMQDGKQMLDTFQQMFGTSGPQGNALA
jgi:hypothetical protein